MIVRVIHQALDDLNAVKESSITRYGKAVASKYMSDIETAFITIGTHPALLRRRAFSEAIRFYFVNKHTLICTVIEDVIYVLAVKYSGMDIESLLDELEHVLLQEADILHRQFIQND